MTIMPALRAYCLVQASQALQLTMEEKVAELIKEYSYTKPALAELAICLSFPRFQPYRNRAKNDEVLAMESYLYNSRVSKSLLYPFHLCEIVLRNAVNDALKEDFSPAWHRNPAFTKMLAPKTAKLLEKGIAEAKTSNIDDVVTELTMGFWFHLFRSIHYALWKDRFHRVVRAVPALQFSEFEPRLQRISRLRNRIAHHEGVLALAEDLSPPAVLRDIEFITSAISKDASEWLASHSTVGKALRSKPQKNGTVGPTVGERSDDRFNLVEMTTLLSELTPEKVSVVMDGDEIVGAIGGREIAEYLFSTMDGDALVAVNEHSVADVINRGGGAVDFVVLQEGMPLTGLQAAIVRRRYAVVLDGTGRVRGVIAAAHRRY